MKVDFPVPDGAQRTMASFRLTTLPSAISLKLTLPEARYAGLLMLLGVAVLGLGLRVALLDRSHWMVEGDEAMVGLMARHVLEGERPVFQAGLPYMSAIQAYEAALFYELFGMTRVALKLVPLIASAAFILTTYWLARSLFSRPAAYVAALVAAAPPIYVLSNTLKAWAPYLEVMALGNVVLVLAVTLAWGARRQRWALLLGVVGGFSFWLTPIAVYYLATGGLALVARLRHRVIALVPALTGGFLIGGLPLWAANLAEDFLTFHFFLEGASGERQTAELADFFLTESLPRVLGLWHPWGDTPAELSWILAAIVGLGVVGLALRGRQTHGWRLAPTDLPLLFAVVVAVFFVFSGFGGPALNPWGVDATGRYVVPLWAVVPLAMAALAQLAWTRSRALAALPLCVVLAVHVFGYVAADPLRVFQSPYWDKLPYSNAELIAHLRANEIRHLWANHWAGFPLMFDAQESIIAADYYDVVVGGGINRFPQHMVAVNRAPRPAFLLVTDEEEPALERRMHELGVTFDKARIPPYVVIEPLSRPVHPSEVIDAIGYEY